MSDPKGPPSAEPPQQGVRRHEQTSLYCQYADLVTRQRPPGWDVVVGKPPSRRPRVANLLLLRHLDSERRDNEARVMRGLWRHLTNTVLLELKGPTDGLRERDLAALLSYGARYLARNECPIVHHNELSLVLVVPRETPTLWREYEHCSLRPEPLDDGYVRLLGMPYTIIVVLLDQVADAERDDYLRLFTTQLDYIQDYGVLAWAQSWLKTDRKDMEHLKHLEGYEDLVRDFAKHFGKQALIDYATPEERRAMLSYMAPEERLAGLSPAQILAGLSPEVREQLLAAMTKNSPGDDGAR